MDAGGKAEAMARLLERERPAAVVALGDDVSDADAFAVLRAARDAGGLDGLAVAIHGPHGMPDVVRDNADLHLASPHEASRLLASIARILDPRRRVIGTNRLASGRARPDPSALLPRRSSRVPQLGRVVASMQLARIAQTMFGVAIVLFALAEYDSPSLAGIVTFASIFPAC